MRALRRLASTWRNDGASRVRFAALTAWGVVAASIGCAQIFGIDDVTLKPGAGGSGGAAQGSSSASTNASSSSSGNVDGGMEAGPPCDPTTRWPTMSASPIVPPFGWAGLNERGADDAGITIGEAVAINCQGVDAGGSLPNGGGMSWGDAGQATLYYDLDTGRYEETFLGPGYSGSITWKSVDNHTYVAQIGQPITKDDVLFPIPWASGNGAALDAAVTELYNGLVNTFGTGIPQSANCRTDTSCDGKACCLQLPDDGTPYHSAYFGTRLLRFYVIFQYANQPQPTPSTPYNFYNFAQFYWNDDSDPSLWKSFDTTQVNAASKGFSGVEYDGQYLYLVPNAAGSLVTRYDTLVPSAFATKGPAWTTFDTTTINPNATGFSGGCFDNTYVYFAPSTNGTVTRYDAQTAFSLSSSWSTFDTTTLTPPAQKFAGAVNNDNTGWVVFVPSTNGVAAAYNTYGGVFGTASSWVTFDLTTIDPGLTQFHGGVSVGNYVYLAPHGTSPNYPGLVAQWNASGDFNDKTMWASFNLATVDPNVSGVAVYDGAVYDGTRYVYFVPAATGATSQGDVMRFDTLAAGGFTAVASWTFYDIGTPVYTTGAWDGRYVYLSGGNTSVQRFDNTGTFSNFMDWSAFDVTPISSSAVAFQGSAFDGRYVYFVPDTFSTLLRFDSFFPQAGVNPQLASFY